MTTHVHVQFTQPHTHAGKHYLAGETLDVRPVVAQWLEASHIAHRVSSGEKAPTVAAQTPVVDKAASPPKKSHDKSSTLTRRLVGEVSLLTPQDENGETPHA